MKPRALLICLALFMIACGGETVETAAVSGGNRDVAPPAPEDDYPSNSSGDESWNPAHRGEEVRLTLQPEAPVVVSGDPLPARIILRNTSAETILLFDPARSLQGNLRFTVRLPSGETRRMVLSQSIPEDAIEEGDLVRIDPGESAAASIDLSAILLELGEGRPGEYRIEVAFFGGYEGKRLSMDVWNRSRMKEVSAGPVRIRVTWPSELADAGITWGLDQQIEELLMEVTARGDLEKGAADQLESLGPGIYGCLIRKLTKAAASSHPEQIIGWSAFRFLRSRHDDRLLAALIENGASETAIGRMLIHWIETDDARASGDGELTPEEEEFREHVLDPRLSGLETFRLTRTSRQGQEMEILTVHGSGLVQYERHSQGTVQATEGQLGEAEIEALFETFARDGFWLHEAVRQTGSEAEGLLKLEHIRSGVGEEADYEEVVNEILVWETEARYFNHPLGRIIDSLLATKLVLRR